MCLSNVQNMCLTNVQNTCLSTVQNMCLSNVQNMCLSNVQNMCLINVQNMCLSNVQNMCLSNVQNMCLSNVQNMCLSNVQNMCLSNVFPKKEHFRIVFHCAGWLLSSKVMHYDRRSGRTSSDEANQLAPPILIGRVINGLTSYTFAAKLTDTWMLMVTVRYKC